MTDPDIEAACEDITKGLKTHKSALDGFQQNKEKTMIKPTIGRKVYYFLRHPDGCLTSHDTSAPFDVNIVYVWGDNCINIAGFDHNGTPFARTSVPINVGPGGDGASAWCEWMPYQVGQAKAAAT